MTQETLEFRLVAALNAVNDLLQSGLAAVAVDIRNPHTETVLLATHRGIPIDFIIEDFESDYWSSMEWMDGEGRMSCRSVDAGGWNEALRKQAVPVFWSHGTAPEGAQLTIPEPWSHTRGGVVPEVATLSAHERLMVHLVEARNFTLRVPLSGVSRVDVVVDGPETIISVHADVSIETRAIYARALSEMKGLLSQLPPGGGWKLQWNEPVPEPGPRSLPVLVERHRALGGPHKETM